jgi:hypothetical protein
LVGIGVALSACVMIFAFLPPLFPERMTSTAAPVSLTPDFSRVRGADNGISSVLTVSRWRKLSIRSLRTNFKLIKT